LKRGVSFDEFKLGRLIDKQQLSGNVSKFLVAWGRVMDSTKQSDSK